jgi:S1-C subfamily serine protease/regulator of sirC expression with transglutaminase-like and TPR domain
MLRLPLLCAILISFVIIAARADEPKPAKPPLDKTVEQLAESAMKSVVVIRATGRDGKQHGLGTGFIVSADGLIATNLHVIGEGRPIAVQLADGTKHEVTTVHATDRALDLALVRIDAKDLKPLELGESAKLKQGAGVVALGNPLGLERSVVSGVASGIREIEGRKMIQLAMPVEPGNSGGPLIDLKGRVQGIVTLKSAVAANLGFAVPIDDLKPLLKKPNPVAMAKWLTIGALDPDEWKPVFGARWRQRAGRILVEGAGEGFGGRALCLSQRPLPELPCEIAVTVKLNDESGAAGLLFYADGENKHYGFYPSGGGLRLTLFDGPDVTSWKILENIKSPHYKPGEFNTLRVRLEKGKFRCYVNDQMVFESTDTSRTSGAIGLCKFRDTQAEFKNFQIAKAIGASAVSADIAARITKAIDGLKPDQMPKPDLVEKLAPDGAASLAVLRERARQLEQQAAQLRRLALAVHRQRVQNDLAAVLKGKETDIDLLHAALLIARLDNDELDVDAYRAEVERMAKKIAASLPKDAADKAKVEALNKFLFAERGYHGSRGDYYHRSNSYLNEVIDDREGLPITLSVLYMELGRRIGLTIEGVGLPGHFVVRQVPKEGDGQLIDVYEGGQLMTRADAEKRVMGITGEALKEEHLKATPKRAIVVRMLHNLLNIARGERDGETMLHYLDAILTVDPDSADDRWVRAVLRFQAGQRDGARADADWLLEKKPAGIDREQVLELRRLLEKEQ